MSYIVDQGTAGSEAETVANEFDSFCGYLYIVIIMRPSSLGGGRILRCTLSVRLSVRPVIERHVAPPSELQ